MGGCRRRQAALRGRNIQPRALPAAGAKGQPARYTSTATVVTGSWTPHSARSRRRLFTALSARASASHQAQIDPVLTWGCLDPELVIRVAGQPDRRLGARGQPGGGPETCPGHLRWPAGPSQRRPHSLGRPRVAAQRRQPARGSQLPRPGIAGKDDNGSRRDPVPLALRAVSLATGRHDHNLGSQAPDLGPLGCRRRTLVPDPRTWPALIRRRWVR
jgi:hypothetical protein